MENIIRSIFNLSIIISYFFFHDDRVSIFLDLESVQDTWSSKYSNNYTNITNKK